MNFIKLVKARETELKEEIAGYDGEDSDLLDAYVVHGDDSDGDFVYKENLGKVEIVEVKTVMVMGGPDGCRCFDQEIIAFKDEAGDIWMNEEQYEDVFC